MKNIMNKILEESINYGVSNSFYLHMMPNLGLKGDREIMKIATEKVNKINVDQVLPKLTGMFL